MAPPAPAEDVYETARTRAALDSRQRRATGDIKGLYGTEKPPGYSDGCHARHHDLEPRIPCHYGDLAATRTMVLMGDSHGAHWFAGLELIAKRDGWKLVNYTKTGCTSPDVSIQLMNEYYAECDTWRRNTVAAIVRLQPDLVVMPLLSRHGLWGRSRTEEPLVVWEDAVQRTATQLGVGRTKVLVLGDTPKSRDNPRGCTMARRNTDLRPCMNPRSEAVFPERIDAERRGAQRAGARFVDVSDWICGPTYCNVVVGNTAVYRDEGHLSNSFTRLLLPQLRRSISDTITPPVQHPAPSRLVAEL